VKLLRALGGNVADMSRHVGDDTTCLSNCGQMGPCRRHKIEDVVAICVGSSRHLPDFPKCVCRNILWYGSTYAQILSHLSTLISVMFSILSCSPHETKITTTLLNTTANTTAHHVRQHHPPMPPTKAMGAITQNRHGRPTTTP
jgi:hypothetical protein